METALAGIESRRSEVPGARIALSDPAVYAFAKTPQRNGGLINGVPGTWARVATVSCY